MARLLSGRVKVTPPTGVSTDRYSYLKLQDAEPNAGVPGVDGYVLASDTSGNRFWRSSPGASAINGITVKDNGVVVGTASSVGSLDFVSSNFTATASGAGATITFNDSPTFTDLTVSGIATFAAVKDLNVTGVSTFQGNVDLGDNDRLRFGDANDLQIYHDSFGSFINESGTGRLRIGGGNEVTIENSSFNEYKARFFTDGAVELYYDNSKKFETTDGGIDVTGHTETDTLRVSGVSTFQSNVLLGDNGKIRLGDNQDLNIFHDGSHSYIQDAGVGNLILDTNGFSIRLTYNDTENMLRAIRNGAVELYYDNSKKFETTGFGVTVSGGLNVSGIATISGLKYPTTDGTANQVVATDGNGNLSLQTLSDLEGFNWETVEQDFGLITDSVNDSPDNGLITGSVANSYDLGFIVTSGLIYPTQFVLPSFTVSTLPSVNPAGQMLLVTDETGGSVPAFSDGTNWRRVTDRQIVS